MNAAKAAKSVQEGGEETRAAAGPIDLAHLRRFTLGDESLELEILGLFSAQTPLTIDALKQARSDRDWTVAAHTLKGSARAVGAWELASLSESAERLGGMSDRPACEQAVRDIEAAAAKAREHIAALGRPR